MAKDMNDITGKKNLSAIPFVYKAFEELHSYKSYYGPLNTLEIGFLYDPRVSFNQDFFIPSDILAVANSDNRYVGAVVITGQYDEIHRPYLERVQNGFNANPAKASDVASVLINYNKRKSFPSIQQAGLLFVGNVENILSALPEGQTAFDHKRIAYDYKKLSASSIQFPVIR